MADIEITSADPATIAGIRAALGAPDAARTLRFPDAEVAPPSPVLPSAATRASKLLGFTSGGALEATTGGGGGGGQFVAPLVSSFTGGWVNQGTATATDIAAGGLLGGLAQLRMFKIAAAAGEQVTALVKPLSGASAWSYTAVLSCRLPATGNHCMGLLLRESSSGKLILYPMRNEAFQVMKFNSPTSWSAMGGAAEMSDILPGFGRTNPPPSVWVFRLVCNGTNIVFSVSPDGQLWTQVHSAVKADFMVPNQVGLFIDPITNPGRSDLRCFHWEES
ncbi:hypothetical protein OKA04_12940 [Luteolibacter flavescens]|uniref:Uncharacterized protein n=1 Tax=Luteolibacter flavescens TaxID=1859460 RepID=A0ABT3FPY4_9BACT|nr:hypothetical protein [Luteolibacter flavescens]MCW1885638.1 hypothetical protein [Luteolibacter flavescens]